jgi:hypothetical protein
MTTALERKIKPKTVINWEIVNQLLECGATQRECASQLGITAPTLAIRCEEDHGLMWQDYSRMWSDKGCNSLRMTQHQKAIDEKDTKMLIWLGKQRLGQTDKIEQDNSQVTLPSVNIYLPDNSRDQNLALDTPRTYLDESFKEILSTDDSQSASSYSSEME